MVVQTDKQPNPARRGPRYKGPGEGADPRVSGVCLKIRDLIESRGLTVAAVAASMGKKQPYMSQLLRGAYDLKLTTLFDIAACLKVPVSSLLRPKKHKSENL